MCIINVQRSDGSLPPSLSPSYSLSPSFSLTLSICVTVSLNVSLSISLSLYIALSLLPSLHLLPIAFPPFVLPIPLPIFCLEWIVLHCICTCVHVLLYVTLYLVVWTFKHEIVLYVSIHYRYMTLFYKVTNECGSFCMYITFEWIIKVLNIFTQKLLLLFSNGGKSDQFPVVGLVSPLTQNPPS